MDLLSLAHGSARHSCGGICSRVHLGLDHHHEESFLQLLELEAVPNRTWDLTSV